MWLMVAALSWLVCVRVTEGTLHLHWSWFVSVIPPGQVVPAKLAWVRGNRPVSR